MRRAQTKQTLKIRLLAFVLARAIIWYSLNPAPRPIIRKKREAEPPEEKKRNVKPRSLPITFPIAFRPMGGIAEPLPSTYKDEDDFEWPEFIDG